MIMKRILFSVLLLCLYCALNAQIQETDVLFYVRTDKSLNNPTTGVEIRRFIHGRCAYCYCNDDLRTVSNNLKKDINYYEKQEKWNTSGSERPDTYDRDMSNEKWNVYSVLHKALVATEGWDGPTWPKHTQFWAYKKNLSEYMYWEEPDYDNIGRRTYRRLTKTDLKNLTFTAARDFLQ